MVRGLEKFKDHFENQGGKYVIIGGTACYLALAEVDIEFRATKDIDVVIILEALDQDFGQVVWEFIRAGGYKNHRTSSGDVTYYRFIEPDDERYPEQLELFSRKPDLITLPDDAHLTPIPLDEEVSSLSAILLDEEYYGLIQTGRSEVSGLPIVLPEYLIPLKAKAFLELTERKNAGGDVDSKDIKKHKNDVFRLYRLLTSETEIELPLSIRVDLRHFIESVENEPPVDLSNFGLKHKSLVEVLTDLGQIYNLDR